MYVPLCLISEQRAALPPGTAGSMKFFCRASLMLALGQVSAFVVPPGSHQISGVSRQQGELKKHMREVAVDTCSPRKATGVHLL